MKRPAIRIGAYLNCDLKDKRGTTAIEFALVLPVMLAVLIGGFQVSQALSAYRKMTVTTRAVADLATQYTSMSASDMSSVLNASAQIMVPFPSSNLSIVLTEFTAPLVGQATVVWSKKLTNGTVTNNASAKSETLPLGVCQPGASVVRADVTYNYTPPIGYKVIGTITMRDSLYMSPRQTKTIIYTGS